MSTIVIVDAGNGLGLSVARVFGHKGFNVAMVARNGQRLDEPVARLTAEGVPAAGFAADVLDPDAIRTAFEQITDRFGEVEVLKYSVVPRRTAPDEAPVGAADVTMEALLPHLDLCLGGALTVIRQVLPGMIERDNGTLIFTTGLSSLHPVPGMALAGIAAAGLRSWAHSLHADLVGTGVHVAHIALGTSATTPDIDVVAPLYWDVYTNRDQVELLLA
ncbi:SDR family NAD(P)-dependent oxidoreductase [Thermopolyspora sp. NPDC052614]|uniref:SDR family NAD(P)-dependent oxidoreductase n=1 Tax=Thermopolyspora sp. NPDC052614 TaxID=3155682 RepID=UPI0034154740